MGLAARALAGLGNSQPAHEPRPKAVGGRLAEAATAALMRKTVEPRLKAAAREARSAAEAPAKRIRLRPELGKRSANAQAGGGMMRAALSGIKRPKPGGLQTRTPVARPRVASDPSVSPKDEATRFRPVNALQIGEARSASPCSPERPARRLAAAVIDRGMSEESAAMSGDSRSCSSRSSSCSEVQITNPPINSPAVSPRKRARLGTADKVLSITPQKGGATEAVAGGGLTGGGFQDAVLERLKQLCGDHEDAHVLAEYIVVMVAGNKGREDMAAEMKPFFADQAQADSFVTWVEECKWKFLTGGTPPIGIGKVGTAGVASSPTQQAKVAVAPTRTSLETSRLAAQARLAPHLASGQPAVRGPHVAVTSRVVLQPNPHFDMAPQQLPIKTAAVASPGKTTFAKASSPKPLSGKREKNELLENMTRQLQTILTKLSDRNLNDETREKYQALAQNIQTQMAKISKPQPVAVRRR